MDFIDLKTQYRRIREPMNARIQAVLDHGQYVLGAETVAVKVGWGGGGGGGGRCRSPVRLSMNPKSELTGLLL